MTTLSSAPLASGSPEPEPKPTAAKRCRSASDLHEDVVHRLRKGGIVLHAVSPAPMYDAAKRTSKFAARSVARVALSSRSKHPEIPVRMPSPRVLAKVFAEEMVMLMASRMGEQAANPLMLERIATETRRTIDLLHRRGHLDDPASYHQTPSAPLHVESSPRRRAGLPYSLVSFDSGYAPLQGMPGGDRWMARDANQRCYAHVLRHEDNRPRPWLVYLHGYNMGGPLDLRLIEAKRYHQELGFNVLAPLLPLHGPRRETSNGAGLFSLDWVANVHGLTQSVWDVRRWLAWAREQDAAAIALHGISLGAYTAALTAGLEPDLDCVVAGLPAGSIYRPLVTATEKRPPVRKAMQEHDLLGEKVEAVHRVVTPTALPCLVPRDQLFIYAGLADRVATPLGPYQLWKHWDEPDIHWAPNTHLGSMMSRPVRRFVREAITATVEPGHRSR